MKAPKIFSTKRQAIEAAKQTVLTVVVVAAILVSVSLVTLNFLFDLSRYNARVISEKEQALSTIEDNIVAVNDLVESFKSFEEGPNLLASQGEKKNSSVVLDALPSQYDFPALATSMELLARRTGLVLDTFSGTDETENAEQSAIEPTPIEMPFELVLIGKYEDVQTFMVRLQDTIRPLKVDRVELSGSDEAIKAEVGIITYYQPSVSLEIETKVVE
ncbi:MAG: type 4a pilus biogenesis protein PilO [Candidatus Saccharimonadales bacterium]|nr:type 4a pilus biogenesis protein PilO [Candidatus Saccharimonadales bacterium]